MSAERLRHPSAIGGGVGVAASLLGRVGTYVPPLGAKGSYVLLRIPRAPMSPEATQGHLCPLGPKGTSPLIRR